MSVVVFAAPYTPPPPPAPKWLGYEMKWRGADGSVWDLQGSQGILILTEGIVGLHEPAHERRTSVSPSRAGFRNRGSRTKERAVEWPLLVYSDKDSAAWRTIDRAFWGSFDPDIPGTWEVTDPSGRTLRLDCLFEGPQDYSYDRDPSRAGWALYQVQLVAPDPFWYGDPVTTTWHQAESVPFFDPAGSPGFHISQTSSLTNSKITNRGDVQTWPTYEIKDEMTSVTIEVDGGAFTIPEQDEGETTVVNTSEGTAIRDGVDISGLLSTWDPRPIPPGSDVPVTITATGTGSVSATIVPRYRRGV